MIFVPLTLIATLALLAALLWFARTQDLTLRAHQLFLSLIALYALQSFLITLRWGYDVPLAAQGVGLVAPVLPALAYVSYAALSGPLNVARLWPLVFVALCWLTLAVARDLADVLILSGYLAFGLALLRQGLKGADHVSLSPIGASRQVVIAMTVTGAALILSGLTDIFILYDFITKDGRHVALVAGLAQTLFVVVIGVSASFGRISGNGETDAAAIVVEERDVVEDAEIVARLEALFQNEGLHRSEDLSLRRLSRRLSLPDRRVSTAINRHRGQSVSQFVNARRVKDACQMLKDSGDTVLAISLAVGFASKSNFNREFARLMGQSPTEWRKSGLHGGAG